MCRGWSIANDDQRCIRIALSHLAKCFKNNATALGFEIGGDKSELLTTRVGISFRHLGFAEDSHRSNSIECPRNSDCTARSTAHLLVNRTRSAFRSQSASAFSMRFKSSVTKLFAAMVDVYIVAKSAIAPSDVRAAPDESQSMGVNP